VKLQHWVPKAQVWAIVEAITSCLNPIGNACVVNQPRGHWLILDALTTTINISLNMEAKIVGLGDGFEILDEFDLEILTL